MAVVNGQIANDTTFNAAFLSRLAATTSTVAIVSLLNNTIASGASVNNVQALLNKLIEGLGTTGEGDTAINNYGAPNYVVNGQTRKAAIIALDAALKAVDDAVAAVDLTPLEARLTNLESNNMNIDGDKTFTGSIVVNGDFTVQGTTTFINSTDLQVVDKNILVNKDGNDASAEDAGVDVKRTSDNGALRFDSSLASKWKLGLASAMYEVLVSGIAQTINGVKTFANEVILGSWLQLNGATSGNVKVKVPAVVTTYDLTLPSAQGAAGQSLINNGAGVLSWGDSGGLGIDLAQVTVLSGDITTASQFEALYGMTYGGSGNITFDTLKESIL